VPFYGDFTVPAYFFVYGVYMLGFTVPAYFFVYGVYMLTAPAYGASLLFSLRHLPRGLAAAVTANDRLAILGIARQLLRISILPP
jgi:hypothetical protein